MCKMEKKLGERSKKWSIMSIPFERSLREMGE